MAKVLVSLCDIARKNNQLILEHNKYQDFDFQANVFLAQKTLVQDRTISIPPLRCGQTLYGCPCFPVGLHFRDLALEIYRCSDK